MSPTTTPVKVYISYDLADEKRLKRLIVHMSVMLAENKVEVWYRNALPAGDEVEKEAKTQLEYADLILFLVSPDYLASKFYLSEASEELLSKKNHLETKLVPIYLRPCDFKRTWLYKFEAMLSRERPIIDYIRKKNADQPYADIVDKIWGLVEELQKFKLAALQPPMELPKPAYPRVVWAPFYVLAETSLPVPILPKYFLPRNKELAELLYRLLGTDWAVAITGLQRMGGIGKSVLAAEVALDERVKTRFPDGIFWLVVGQTPNLISLQSILARALGYKGAITSVEEGKALLAKLFQNKTCLLVLDDVWKPAHAQALALTEARGKTLVTTRKEEVVTGLAAGHYPLDKMSPVQAVGLLARAALTTSAQLPMVVAEEIAQECGYLPLALSIAGAMAYEQGHDWEYVLAKLKESGLEGVFRSIEVSLNDQPDLTGYYLDLAVFPENTAIPLEALQALWGVGRQETEEIAIRLGHASLVRWQAGYTKLTLHDLQYAYVKLKRQEAIPALHHQLVNGYQKSCPGGDWERGTDDGYFYEKICWHLQKAGQTKELRELLLDYRWMAAKLGTSGIAELLGDYLYLVGDVEIKLVLDALELSTHVVARDSKQLGTQLYRWLLPFRGKPNLQTLLEQLKREIPKPWLRPLHTHLTVGDGPLKRTLAGHSGSVRSVAFSPDGQFALSASGDLFGPDNTLKVWDWHNGELIRTLEGHKRSVNSVAFSPDGKYALSGSYDNTLKVWDWQSGELIRTLEGHSYSVNSVAFSPDGKYALSGSEDNTLKVWDWQSGELIRTLEGHSGSVNSVAFSPDGKYALSGSYDNTLKVWDWQSGELIRTLECYNRSVNSVTFSPDGKYALSGSNDWTLWLWDWQNGELIRTLEGHKRSVNSVAFSPDGKYALSGSYDNTLKLWDWQKGKLICTIKGHNHSVNSVAFSPDGKYALSGSYDNTLKLWDWQSGELIRTLEGHNHSVNSVAFSPDGKYALSDSGDNTLKVWDWQSGELIRTLEGHNHSVNSVAFSPDGKYALSDSGDNTLKVWDWQSGELIRTLEGHNHSVNSVAFSPNGKYTLSGSNDWTLKLWDWQKKKLIRTLEGHSGSVNSVAFSPDGKYALSGSNDWTLKLWDWQKKKLIRTLEGHSGSVNSVAFSPNGKYTLSGSYDWTLKLWDWQKKKLIRTLEGHSGSVNSVAFSPNGKYALSGSEDNTIILWDWQKGVVRARFNLESPVFCCAFSQDGQFIATNDNVRQVYFFKLEV